MLSFFILSADPKNTNPSDLAQFALYLVLFFILVGVVAFLTAYASNLYFNLHLVRMRNRLERSKRLEKLCEQTFNQPTVSTKGRDKLLREAGVLVDADYLAHLNSMSTKERDKFLHGSFDAE